MTINTITPFGGYEARRLEQQEQQRQENQKAAVVQESGTDRISISEEGRLKMNMLKAAQETDGVRADKVADVKAGVLAKELKGKTLDSVSGRFDFQEIPIRGK